SRAPGGPRGSRAPPSRPRHRVRRDEDPRGRPNRGLPPAVLPGEQRDGPPRRRLPAPAPRRPRSPPRSRIPGLDDPVPRERGEDGRARLRGPPRVPRPRTLGVLVVRAELPLATLVRGIEHLQDLRGLPLPALRDLPELLPVRGEHRAHGP